MVPLMNPWILNFCYPLLSLHEEAPVRYEKRTEAPRMQLPCMVLRTCPKRSHAEQAYLLTQYCLYGKKLFG